MWRKVFQVLGLVAALLSLLPLIAADYWWIRVFDFPHLQLTAFTLLAILLFFFTFKPRWINDYAYITVLLGCFTFQFFKIVDYTPLVPVEVKNSSSTISNENLLSIYTVNVLQENKKREELFKEIESKKPDLIVFTETNEKWSHAIKNRIGMSYPFKVEQPQDNTYGMLVYSRLELSDTRIKFQADPEIPSIDAKVKMRNGDLLQLYAIHPTPPMPQHNPLSTDRDKELMLTAIASNKSEIPVIVLGDFNDVTWSESTQLTKTIGKLLDLRIGRGFYSTYHAQYPLMKWPLDHILISPEFRLKTAGTGVDFNSDHFPLWAILAYEPELASQQQPNKPVEEDWEQVKMQLKTTDLESLFDIQDEL
ncbi:endonuclease/exonuclease/phosphatase family protein [uncultured Nonlabens sp.]|uniref:endonuclease/exonuclease/phosphatase family protein n=1 Tax=uncultured Nonlabens sp. TaxID=859306 RepID=UPI00263364BC|nr:endonuclease/exonuclease/phosphatase family protein [uncultured Nonlabens sp.]